MIKSYYKKILLNPRNVRIAYDIVIPLLVSGIVILAFQLFGMPSLSYINIFFLTFLFVFGNYFLGIYGRYKASSDILKKSILISSSGICILFITFIAGQLSLAFLIATIFTVILSILPRFFFNVYNVNDKYQKLNYIISEKLPILVVGGGGYIGTHVVEKLLREKYKVRVFDKFLYSRNVFSDMEHNRNLEIIEGDITDLYSLTMALKNVQAVVHLAGIVGDPAAKLDEKLTRHVNIVSTKMLKESVKAFQIPKFIFASSCSVYGASSKLVTEHSPLNPVSLYARTKIDSENELLYDPIDDFHPTILRFATVFGNSRKPRFDLVANLFVAQAYNNGLITVINGKQWRPFVHVSDVAESVIKVIQAPVDKVSRQIFNVGDDTQHLQIGQLAQKVAKIVSEDRKVKISTKDFIDDRRNYRVSFKKINETLGFKASVSIEEGIREIYENFKAHKYQLPLNDPYYSNVEMTKIIKKEFYSENYRKTHFTGLSS
jgi:nucleoside-diphosphate-sugar epimerase